MFSHLLLTYDIYSLQIIWLCNRIYIKWHKIPYDKSYYFLIIAFFYTLWIFLREITSYSCLLGSIYEDIYRLCYYHAICQGLIFWKHYITSNFSKWSFKLRVLFLAFIINCSFCINGVIRKKMWKISREHSKLNEKKPGTPRKKIRKTIKRQIIPQKHYIEHYVSTPPKSWVISGAMEEKVDSAPLVGPVMLLRVNTDLVIRLFPSYQNWGKEDMIVVMTFETYWWSSMTLAT